MNKTYRLLAISFVALLALFTIYGFIVNWAFKSFECAGAFGDTYGALNAFFASIAGLGVVIAIFQQHHQIRLQRTELILQRRELRLQRDEMQKSREELAEQARMQRMAFYSNALILKFDMLKCQNMADQMESETNIPGSRGHWIERIRKRTVMMEAYIRELEDREDPTK